VTASGSRQPFDAKLSIDVGGARALDAFSHPFAYAPGGLDFGCANGETSTSNRPERSAVR